MIFNLNAPAQDDSLTINKTTLTTAIITESVLYAGMISGLRYAWYKDVSRVPFHFYNDNKGYLQIDKFGHAYGSFLESKICYEWLRKAGVSKKKALLYGGTMGIVLQTPIEVFDGLYEGWGFSWGDMIANGAGSLFLMSQEALFDDQLIDFKFSFRRSSYADASNGLLGDNQLESLFYDYNGHSYWLSFSPSNRIPRWVNVSIGYSANGMYGEFRNFTSYKKVPLPLVERHRQFLLSMDIDWTKIPADRPFLRKLFFALNHIKLPFPALEYNSLKQWKFHSFYF
ncbi:hypothetical protein GCM10007940_00350 [Portibacter lacus]|uniref:DUF2279 domain-containing protein n=2 Tax=Portibacter lacus TaxID=1099794 RepID=A0AA37WDR6_9BACT|nr:hypothetical protein GCM10007940_00350 [Portibacter lacus]